MMDRIFEQSQKLINDQFTFWTAQATQSSERLMGQGEAILKLTGDFVNTTVKEQTRLVENLGKQTASFAQEAAGFAKQQASLFTNAFKPTA